VLPSNLSTKYFLLICSSIQNTVTLALSSLICSTWVSLLLTTLLVPCRYPLPSFTVSKPKPPRAEANRITTVPGSASSTKERNRKCLCTFLLNSSSIFGCQSQHCLQRALLYRHQSLSSASLHRPVPSFPPLSGYSSLPTMTVTNSHELYTLFWLLIVITKACGTHH
jgi:hypothetical protein